MAHGFPVIGLRAGAMISNGALRNNGPTTLGAICHPFEPVLFYDEASVKYVIYYGMGIDAPHALRSDYYCSAWLWIDRRRTSV